MKTPNRAVDDFPYSRENAERLVNLAVDVATSTTAFESYFAEVMSKTPTYREIHFENRLVRGVGLSNFMGDVEDLVSASFPELMPIDWKGAER